MPPSKPEIVTWSARALADARGDRADADFGDQLHRDARVRVDVLEVVDELRQVLDRIDVVVRRRRDQADARRRMADARDVLVDLVAGQLAALAGLGALRHLDLQVVGIDQIFGGDAEAARGDLLDRRAHRIAVGQRLEAVALPRRPRRCSSLPPIRFMAMASVVCASRLIEPKLIAPVAKRLTISAAGSTSSIGTGVSAALELHQAADGQQPLALLVDRLRRTPCTRPAGCRAPHAAGSATAVRRPGMVLAAQAEGVVAADVEHGAVDRIVAVGVAVAAHRLLGDLLPARRPRSWWRCR